MELSDLKRWMEFLATAQMECSRCQVLAGVVHLSMSNRGAMCERCLVAMPKEEFKGLQREPV